MEYLIRLPHGYFRGGISDLPKISPTIDAHIACWHVLIGEIDEMADMTCKQVATLTGGKWDKCLESNRRVYSTENVSPTITTCGGGIRK